MKRRKGTAKIKAASVLNGHKGKPTALTRTETGSVKPGITSGVATLRRMRRRPSGRATDRARNPTA
ncbi:MAG: hypothetical protein HP496_12400 [Nitrospira sp.]|nr:hypothetical protein [Nitrospira sp.]